MSVEYSSVLIRYGEIAIKSHRTRKRMIGRLIRNIKCALDEHGVSYEKVRTEYGRLFVESHETMRAAEVVSQVFGVVSVSPVMVIEADMEEILQFGLALARVEFQKGKTFAVGSRRIGTHSFTSQDIREQLGAYILENLSDYNLMVNLKNPDQEIYVEVRDDSAYLFTKTIEGIGGMPTGTQGRVVCTVSTGLDSPIAAFKVMKRGCVPVFVHFDMSPYGDERCRDLAIRQITHLAKFIHGYEVKLYIVSHGGDMHQVQERCANKMTCIFCKRNIMRMARLIAIKEDADAIVTGEIIGEQASQTSRNLRVINSAICDYPILRPCVGDDKVEIEHLAARIGTYQFAQEGLSCCTLAPKYPSIHADLAIIEQEEKHLDLSILEEQVENAEILILRQK